MKWKELGAILVQDRVESEAYLFLWKERKNCLFKVRRLYNCLVGFRGNKIRNKKLFVVLFSTDVCRVGGKTSMSTKINLLCVSFDFYPFSLWSRARKRPPPSAFVVVYQHWDQIHNLSFLFPLYCTEENAYPKWVVLCHAHVDTTVERVLCVCVSVEHPQRLVGSRPLHSMPSKRVERSEGAIRYNKFSLIA